MINKTHSVVAQSHNVASEYLVNLVLSKFNEINAFGRWAPEAPINQTLRFIVFGPLNGPKTTKRIDLCFQGLTSYMRSVFLS